ARLFRSEDGGRSFANCAPSNRIDAIALAPDGALYLAAGAMLFASTDRGRSWASAPLPIAQPEAGGAIYQVRSLLADPAVAGTIYASIEGLRPGGPPFLSRLT